MSFFLAPVITFYDYATRSVSPLAWLGVPVSALDIAGALRLAVALRQLRGVYYDQHVTKAAPTPTGPRTRSGRIGGRSTQRAASDELPEPRSRVRDFVTTLVMVHGGEAIVGTWIVYPIPSIFLICVFFLSIKLHLPGVPYRPRPSHSPLAWPPTVVFRIEDILCVVFGRSSPRRPLAHNTGPIPANRSPPDDSPRVLSHDFAVQYSSPSGRRTRLAHRGSFFLHPIAGRLGKCPVAQ
jgi:hypothetical protein